MRYFVLLLGLFSFSASAQIPSQVASQLTEAEVRSSVQTGSAEGEPEIYQDPTSLAGRGGPAVRPKTYGETIGTPIGTEIRTEIGTRMGAPH